jgi:hypothetical protein
VTFVHSDTDGIVELALLRRETRMGRCKAERLNLEAELGLESLHECAIHESR